jgi:hypothetical protein
MPSNCRLFRRTANALIAILLFASISCSKETPQYGPLDHLFDDPSGRFLQVSSYDTTGGNADRLEIAAGETAVLLDTEGPGIIQRIWITVSSHDPHYLRRIALKMYWDDETEPSVSVPLGDFFGNGFDKRHYSALPMGVSSGGFYCYLPMPFERRARIVVENGTGIEIDAFYYQIGLVEVEFLPNDVPTFHAWWHRDIRTEEPEPHLVLDAVGSGRFVGLSLNAESYLDELVFLEGDEVFFVDGEFRGQGTGVEDYFNSGWYFQHGTFAAPYHGLVLKDEDRGRIAAYRWHIPDPVAFQDSISITLEHGHDNTEVVDYATTAYWYQSEPHESFAPIPPPDARRVLGVKIPPGAVLANGLIAPAIDSARISVTVPVPRPDRYEVIVYPMGGPGAGITTYRLGGSRAFRVDRDSPDINTVLEPIALGVVSSEDWVGIEVLADSIAEVPAAVDVQPVRDWARDWNVVGPFQNPRLLGTEISLALDSVYGPESDQSLSAVYPTPLGGQARWRRATISPDGQLRLNPYFTPNDWVAAYALAFLYSPDSRDATLLFSADDAHVLWVNGEQISERQGRHISRPDELEASVQLRAGWNRVLLKIADLDGGWAFQMRVADPEGIFRWSPQPPLRPPDQPATY